MEARLLYTTEKNSDDRTGSRKGWIFGNLWIYTNLVETKINRIYKIVK